MSDASIASFSYCKNQPIQTIIVVIYTSFARENHSHRLGNKSIPHAINNFSD